MRPAELGRAPAPTGRARAVPDPVEHRYVEDIARVHPVIQAHVRAGENQMSCNSFVTQTCGSTKRTGHPQNKSIASASALAPSGRRQTRRQRYHRVPLRRTWYRCLTIGHLRAPGQPAEAS